MILNVALFVKSVSWRSMTLVLLLGALVGCQSLTDSADWPSDVPERDYFLDAYQADTENQQEQTQQQYLSWIIRFYQGSDLMSTVGAVMRGELSAEEISDERYMTLLDLPDFF